MNPTGFRDWLETLASAEAVVPARVVLERLPDEEVDEPCPPPTTMPAEPSWRIRLWDVPSETRLGVTEVAEALNRPRSYVYAKTSAKMIPFRKLDGTITVTAGELRAWIREHEDVVAAGEMAPPVRSVS